MGGRHLSILLVFLTIPLSGCLLDRSNLVPTPSDSSQGGAGGSEYDASVDQSASPFSDSSPPDTAPDAAVHPDGQLQDAWTKDTDPSDTHLPTEASQDGTVLPGQDAGESGPGIVERPDGYPCKKIPLIDSMPKLDGELDHALTNLLITQSMSAWKWIEYEDAQPSANIVVHWAVAVVKNEGIWFYTEVRDPKKLAPEYPTNYVDTDNKHIWAPWRGDSVELYVDFNGKFSRSPLYDETGTAQFIIPYNFPPESKAPIGRRYRVLPAPAAGVRDWNPTPKNRVVWKNTAQGYAVEVLVKPSDTEMPDSSFSAPSKVGINLAVNSCEKAKRQGICDAYQASGQYMFHCGDDDCDEKAPYSTVEGFCTPAVVLATFPTN